MNNGVDIVVATPGRLLDLMNQGFVKLSAIETFILDEADRMLDMGFIPDIKRILAKLPRQRQTAFFSATLAPEIVSLANGMGVEGARVDTLESFADVFSAACVKRGPFLIQFNI